MRSYLLLIFIFAMLPICIWRPYIGGLMWVWIGLMNPHRLTWGVAYSFPVAKIIAVVTLIGFVTTSEKDKFPKERETLLLICLIIWFTITTLYALAPEDAWKRWDLVIKVFLMTFVALFLFQDRTKFKYLVTTIALSVG